MPPTTSEIPEKPEVPSSYNKEEFEAFVKKALTQIEEISNAYKKLFEDLGEEGQPLIVEIEGKLNAIKEEYESLFKDTPSTVSKIKELNKKIEEIQTYHAGLLVGEKSIKADIDESQEKITEFYVYLFGGKETPVGEEVKLKKLIQEIAEFHTKLNKDDGYINVIDNAYEEITKTLSDLYDKDPSKQDDSKITLLYKDIEKIKTFRNTLDTVTIPFMEDTKKDIVVMSKDVNSLLGGASGGSLIQGFLESKMEYKQEPKYIKLTQGPIDVIYYVLNMFKFTTNFAVILIDYILFLFPLLLSVFIFVQPDIFLRVIDSGSKNMSLSDFLNSQSFYGRLVINLPLWWISWFGQRSISQKRRLAEEYNHKAQVAKMYLNFTSRETSGNYPISKEARAELDNVLIAAIERHPGHVYGDDESFLDKIIDIIKASKEAVKDAVNKAKPSTTG